MFSIIARVLEGVWRPVPSVKGDFAFFSCPLFGLVSGCVGGFWPGVWRVLPRLWPELFACPEAGQNEEREGAGSPFIEGVGRQTPSKTRTISDGGSEVCVECHSPFLVGCNCR